MKKNKEKNLHINHGDRINSLLTELNQVRFSFLKKTGDRSTNYASEEFLQPSVQPRQRMGGHAETPIPYAHLGNTMFKNRVGRGKTKLSLDNVRNEEEDRWREKYVVYRKQKGAFQAGKRELGASFHLAAPNFSAVRRILTQLAEPSAWDAGERAGDGWESGAGQQVGKWWTFVSGKEIGCAERAESSGGQDLSLRGPRRSRNHPGLL